MILIGKVVGAELVLNFLDFGSLSSSLIEAFDELFVSPGRLRCLGGNKEKDLEVEYLVLRWKYMIIQSSNSSADSCYFARAC